MTDDALKQQIKQLIVETLNLEDIQPDDIADDQALTDSGLGLDSIDALELVVQIEKRFGLKLENSEDAKLALRDVNSMVAVIRRYQTAS